MTHYGVELWVDYARDVVGDEVRAAMDAHLSGGCSRCQATRDVLGRFAELAAQDRQNEPPEQVVQRAEAIFESRRPVDLKAFTTTLARLVYDSVRDPLPAGARAQGQPRQALYETDDHSIHIQVDRERPGRDRAIPRLVVVGQIVDRSQPGRRLEEVPVLLKSGRQVTATAVTNSLGEFHIECLPEAGLRLEIPVGDGSVIELPLLARAEGGIALQEG